MFQFGGLNNALFYCWLMVGMMAASLRSAAHPIAQAHSPAASWMRRGAAVLLAVSPCSAVLLGSEIVLLCDNKIDQQPPLGSQRHIAAYTT